MNKTSPQRLDSSVAFDIAKAMLDGEEYIVNGQNVWTSGGHYAE